MFHPLAQDQIAIGSDGSVTAGGRRVGRLDVVTVRSPEQLTSVGDNAFVTSAASGNAVAAPRATTLAQGALEMSNVDMSQELVNMIIAQRTYQANAQTIKTQDQVLQTLINLR